MLIYGLSMDKIHPYINNSPSSLNNRCLVRLGSEWERIVALESTSEPSARMMTDIEGL